MSKRVFNAKEALASMNTKLYQDCLMKFKKSLKEDRRQAEKDIEERCELCSNMQSYTKEKLKTLTEDGLYELIASLWAMNIWGNKRYYVDTLIANNGIDTIRKELVNLLHGTQPLEKRWDDFMEHMKGFGPAMVSEILNKYNPNEFILWNSKARNAFLSLGIPHVTKYNTNIEGKRYAYYCEVAKGLKDQANNLGVKDIDNLLALDYFVWQELQTDSSTVPSGGVNQIVDESQETEKEKKFVHNDVRDKIAEIGQMLGFNSATERKIADGAVVDTIWEISIGNMGRITYVFEVQTSGSIDSLLMNLMKAKNNPSVQGIVAVSDAKQIEKIKKEANGLKNIRDELKCWNYEEVLQVHESLSAAFEKINNLGLVPSK